MTYFTDTTPLSTHSFAVMLARQYLDDPSLRVALPFRFLAVAGNFKLSLDITIPETSVNIGTKFPYRVLHTQADVVTFITKAVQA